MKAAGTWPTARRESVRYTGGHRAIDKAQKRLRGLSKYTRKPTRARLVDKLIERQVFVDEQIDKVMEMVL